MTPRHVRGILLDRPDARGLARLRGTQDVEPDEGGGRMTPSPGLHDVGKDRVDPVRSRRHLCREGFHLGVFAALGRSVSPCEFFLAEAVAKPAHGETMVETNPFGHPEIRDCVTQGPCFLWGSMSGSCHVTAVCQKVPPHTAYVPQLNGTGADERQLGVGATGNDGRAGGETRFSAPRFC